MIDKSNGYEVAKYLVGKLKRWQGTGPDSQGRILAINYDSVCEHLRTMHPCERARIQFWGDEAVPTPDDVYRACKYFERESK